MSDNFEEFLDQRTRPLADPGYGTDEGPDSFDELVETPSSKSNGRRRPRGRPPGSGGKRVSRVKLGRARSMFRTASGDEPDHLIRFRLHFVKPTELREGEELLAEELMPTWEVRRCRSTDKAGSADS